MARSAQSFILFSVWSDSFLFKPASGLKGAVLRKEEGRNQKQRMKGGDSLRDQCVHHHTPQRQNYQKYAS